VYRPRIYVDVDLMVEERWYQKVPNIEQSSVRESTSAVGNLVGVKWNCARMGQRGGG
jgi:hypothetical protein